MKDSKKIFNKYVVMAIIGLVMALVIRHLTGREYIIGLFHGAGIFMFFYGVFANAVVETKARLKENNEK